VHDLGHAELLNDMIDDVELSRRTWTAAIRLAVVISVLAAALAVTLSSLGNIPDVAIVLPVIVIAFTASWVQTSRIRNDRVAVAPMPALTRTGV